MCFHEVVEFRRIDFRQLTPAIEMLAVDDAFRAHRHHEIMLRVVGDNADGVGTRRRAELNGEGAEAARRTPH